MSSGSGMSAEDFDNWYSDMQDSVAQDAIHQRHLGLPPRLLSSSLLTWDGIAEVVEALRIEPGNRLLDLACGRGGYGLEIASRTGAQLIGVDFARAALGQAQALARHFDSVDAEFILGDLAGTTLASGSVDAVACVDAIQFQPTAASFGEIRRVLRPGGRVALTTWEAADPADERVPARIRAVDTEGGLAGAGFTNVVVRERPQWRAAERAMWEEAAALDPGEDPALQSLHDEALRVLPAFEGMRRVLATAAAAG
ncbi:class I SAM-dependent methyltransferase [Amycolatopsis rubida]|uniref:Class I SAM-dependent methyltransferase n=1 Tax=Amycolatopsis rubida TaxID=112413 RepID=A0ABX0BU94_9PSEU|nr:class I SAM-dependent methyltransferase [Amycolatopsis sp. M39]MYW91426.1 methyltransferase domain-containing protein [Amycolatopsis rubida]NEC56411.1 class I SAM-dependent methyltransferase [Amycolatopsis rubida]OAP22553.1 Demethylrebeccamycin-D-glucose O-methyltransferase [Amycolatopsis sp. M39]